MWDKEDVISEKGGKVGCEVRVAYYCQLISVNRLNDVGIGFTTFKNCNIGAIHMLEGVLRFTINVDFGTPFLALKKEKNQLKGNEIW